MSQELIERLFGRAVAVADLLSDYAWKPHRSHVESLLKNIRDAIEALASQDKRIAELEPQAKELQGIAFQVGEEDDPFAAWEAIQALQARAEAAESALSLAESRGRQIGREEAAAWHEAEANRLIAENDAIKAVGGWADTNGRLVPAEAHRISAAAIRNLPTNEAGE